MSKTKEISFLGILSALYVVCALTLKIPTGVGNIALDLGYIVLTVACLLFGWKACIVGGVGAFLESLLFSAYGISYGWIVMNIIIGVFCGIVFTLVKRYTDKKLFRYLGCGDAIIIGVLLGVAAKTIIECKLYSIPYMVKIPKSFVAFIIDTAVMLVGLPLAFRVVKLVKKN